MSGEHLLFELGTEELPPGSLRALGEALRDELCARLSEHRIPCGKARWYAAPRRLAVLIEGLAARQGDALIEKLGPLVGAAFDATGQPTGAALGFARSCGVEVAQLTRVPGDKGERLAFLQRVEGKASATQLPGLIESALAALPIARRMRWGTRRLEFVRPVHWVVLMHGTTIVPGSVLGVPTGRETRGHRVHGKPRIRLDHASSYAEILRTEGFVIADYAERRALIAAQVQQAAQAEGGTAEQDDVLLDEVCSLVEWPRALAGHFEERFLDVPAEALVSSMKGHQKFFPVRDARGALLPCFVTVANLDSVDAAQVILGNERVIRPRLSDAAFFFLQDKKVSLASRRERLRSIVFQTELGSLWDKTERVARLAESIGVSLGSDAALCRRAGELSKSDLVSEMVLEFDELQGTMGRYYALHDGEHSDVANAIAEQYLPRHSGDRLPMSTTGCALALADRIDTLVGIFGIGQQPTGSKDPFALRRAALGVLRILVERELLLDLLPILESAAAGYAWFSRPDQVVGEVSAYVFERFRSWYQDAGVPAECVHAVMARGVTTPLDFDRRVRAVAQFAVLRETSSLAAGNKRVANILLKQGDANHEAAIDHAMLAEPAEAALAQALQQCSRLSGARVAVGDYSGALSALARLQEPVDAFFNHVLVMCDDARLRTNRLALLGALRKAFLSIADISALVVA